MMPGRDGPGAVFPQRVAQNARASRSPAPRHAWHRNRESFYAPGDGRRRGNPADAIPGAGRHGTYPERIGTRAPCSTGLPTQESPYRECQAGRENGYPVSCPPGFPVTVAIFSAGAAVTGQAHLARDGRHYLQAAVAADYPTTARSPGRRVRGWTATSQSVRSVPTGQACHDRGRTGERGGGQGSRPGEAP